MNKFKFGDRVRIVIEGKIDEIKQDNLGTKYFIVGADGYGLSSARNPKEIELIEGVENGS